MAFKNVRSSHQLYKTRLLCVIEIFLKIANKELDRNVTQFSPEVIECFMSYRWQGNVRELKNIVRRAALLTEGNEITIKALPLEISNYKIPAYDYGQQNSYNQPLSYSPSIQHTPDVKEIRHDLAFGPPHPQARAGQGRSG